MGMANLRATRVVMGVAAMGLALPVLAPREAFAQG
jgi:hypothetical protein